MRKAFLPKRLRRRIRRIGRFSRVVARPGSVVRLALVARWSAVLLATIAFIAAISVTILPSVDRAAHFSLATFCLFIGIVLFVHSFLSGQALAVGKKSKAYASRQTALAELNELILNEADFELVLRRTAEIAADELSVDCAVVFELKPGDEAAVVRACGIGMERKRGSRSLCSPDSFLEHSFSSQEPVVISELAAEKRFAPPARLLELGVVSIADVPIRGRDGPWGVLGVRTTERREFAADEIEYLRALAGTLALVIGRGEYEKQIERERAEAAFLSEQVNVIIDTAPAAIIEIDLEKRVVVWNKVAEEIFGWTREEAIGNPLPIVPEHMRADHEQLVEKVLRGERVIGHETERRRRDGTLIPYQISVSPHTNSAGEVIGVVGIGIDLSKRKLTEEELTHNRELYRVMVEHSHDVIAVLDSMGRFVFASPSYEEILGYKPEELIDVSPISLVHPADVQRASDALRQVVTGQNTAVVELRMRHKRGNWVYVEGTTTSIFDDKGPLQSILMSFRDISERRVAEEELREAETRYRLLVEQLPLITYIGTPGESGRWVYLSPQLEEILGHEPSEWTSDSQNFVEAIHPDDRERVVAERAASGNKGRIGLEYRLSSKDGRTVWVHEEAVVVRDLSGKPLYLQGYLLDTSSEHEAEAERQRLETQLLHAMKMEAVGRLAGGVAHEFNNSLTVITLASDSILSELDPTNPLVREIEEIKRAAERAGAITKQLLAFSSHQVLQPTLLNLDEVIREMGAMLRHLIGENIELVTNLDGDIPPICSDRSQIEQVIMNLVVNARDAMPNGGQITIKTAVKTVEAAKAAELGLSAGEYVLVTVSDTGVGMSDETMSHIFEPFFTTKGRGEGTGLGLSTVHGIVEQSSGAIEVSSEVGEGSEFRIYLPPAEKESGMVETEAPPEEARGTETILLVEDEEMVRQLIARVLEELGYTVLDASSGEGALALAASVDRPIDLLVTDVVMPGMSGNELAELLTVSRPAMGVLFMSGYTEEAIIQHGVLSGETEFIGKPFTPQELAEKIRAVLDSRKRAKRPRSATK